MKINTQKWTRVASCSLVAVMVLLISVAPAYAASLPGRFYTFDEHIALPEDQTTADKLLSGYAIDGVAYESGSEFDYIGLRVTLGTLFLEFPIDGNRTAVASFNMGALTPDSSWVLRDYQVLFFPSNVSIDDDILQWMEDNGKFTAEAPILKLPEFDFDSIFDSDILSNEYMTFSTKVGLLLRNNVTMPIVLSLFGLVLISFILYGKK